MISSTKRPTRGDEHNFRYRSPAGATLMDVRGATKLLNRSLVAAGLPGSDVASAEIAVAEVLNNVVKHAQDNCRKGWFELSCEIQPDGVQITCRDNGVEMPDGEPPAENFPNTETPVATLPEGGWGWSIVRTLTTQLVYTRVAHTNLVTFTLPNGSPEPTH